MSVERATVLLGLDDKDVFTFEELTNRQFYARKRDVSAEEVICEEEAFFCLLTRSRQVAEAIQTLKPYVVEEKSLLFSKLDSGWVAALIAFMPLAFQLSLFFQSSQKNHL